MDKEGKERGEFQGRLLLMQQNCESIEKTIKEEKYRIDISMAKMAEDKEKELTLKLKDHERTAFMHAERNVQQIERNIHAENQELTEKTMSQRYTLDYLRREKENLEEAHRNAMRDLDIE